MLKPLLRLSVVVCLTLALCAGCGPKQPDPNDPDSKANFLRRRPSLGGGVRTGGPAHRAKRD